MSTRMLDRRKEARKPRTIRKNKIDENIIERTFFCQKVILSQEKVLLPAEIGKGWSMNVNE